MKAANRVVLIAGIKTRAFVDQSRTANDVALLYYGTDRRTLPTQQERERQ